MSKYSEVIGSFIRMGNFPLEANYVFETEEALKNFYKDEVLKATLHKGLLKIVANDTELSLYWVAKKQTNDDLEFVKLISYNDVNDLNSKLTDLLDKINKEISDRKEADDVIWGSTNHDEVPDNLNSLLDLSYAIINLREDLNDYKEEANGKLQNLLDYCKALAGTSMDDIPAYLESLDYGNLTTVSENLNKFLNTFDPDDNKINTLPEIQEFLHGYTDTDKLHNLLEDLWHKIEGDPMPSEQFRTLRGIEDYILVFVNRVHNLQTELDQTQVGVGLSGDGAYNADQETTYLKNATSVMNALKILDSLINEAINNCNLEAENTNTVNVSIDKYADKTTISADVRLSTSEGNSIIAKNDGLYHKISSTYEDGVLTLYVNDTVIGLHILGLAYVGISEAKYDSTTEELVIAFRKEDGSIEELRISAASLIREWVVDNSGASDTVILTRTEVLGNGPDKLSADVRILDDKYNILTKSGNNLYVRGTADNIVWNDVKVSDILDNLQTSASDLEEALIEEIDRSTKADDKHDQLFRDLEDRFLNLYRAGDGIKLTDNRFSIQVDPDTEPYLTLSSAGIKVSGITDAIISRVERETLRALSAEEHLTDVLEHLGTRVQTCEENTQSLKTQVLEEADRALLAEQDLANQIKVESERSKEKDLQFETRFLETDNKITLTNRDLLAEVNRATAAENTLANDITNETNRAIQAEKDLGYKISLETERATNAETNLESSINLEVIRAKEAENNLKELINNNNTSNSEVLKETLDLIKELGEKVTANTTSITETQTDLNELRRDLNTEVTRAENAELNLLTQITELSNEKANVGDSYTKEQSDEKYLTKENAASTYATKTEVQTLNTEVQVAKESIDNLKTEVNNIDTRTDALETKVQTLLGDGDQSLNSILNESKEYTDNSIVNLETKVTEELDKKVETVTLRKNTELSYTLVVDGTDSGNIIIPDHIDNVTYANSTLTFTFSNGKAPINVPIDKYTAGAGLVLNGNQFAVKLDPTTEEFLKLSAEGIKITGVQDAIDVEKARAEAKEAELEQAIETSNNNLTTLINTEKTNREAADAALKTELKTYTDTKVKEVSDRVDVLEDKVDIINGTGEGSLQNVLEQANAHTDSILKDFTSEKFDALTEKVNTNTTNILTILNTTIPNAIKTAKLYTDEQVANKIETVEVVSENDLQYSIVVDGAKVGTINIPQDTFLDSATYDSRTKDLTFIFNTASGKTSIPVSLADLVDTYTAGDGLKLENNKFSVKVSEGSQPYLQVLPGGIAIKGLDEVLTTKATVTQLETVKDTLATNDQAVKDLRTELNSEVTRATTAEQGLLSKLDLEISRSTLKDADHDTLLAQHTTKLNTLDGKVATLEENLADAIINTDLLNTKVDKKNPTSEGKGAHDGTLEVTGKLTTDYSPSINDSSNTVATTAWVKSVVPSPSAVALYLWDNYEE